MNGINVRLAGAAALLVLGMTACGGAAEPSATADPDAGSGGAAPAAGMCAEGHPDCVDTVFPGEDDPVEIDETGIEQFRRDARAYLGAHRDELPDSVRVGRVGDEDLALTDDFVVGRITVGLDDLGDGPVVTSATVELPEGPETFTLES